MYACINCKHRPATTSGGLCDDAVCGDEVAAARNHPTQYARAATVAATYTVTSPAGAKHRCVRCGVMPAQHTAPVIGAAHGETVGLCSELCRVQYNKAPLEQAHIGSFLERWRYGVRTRRIAEEVFAMMNAAAQWDRQGAVNYAEFLEKTGYYVLLHKMLTRDGQRNLSLDRYREFGDEVRAGVKTSMDSQLVRIEVPEPGQYSAGALSGSVATMYKRMWRESRGIDLLRDQDVRVYAGRIYRDIMMLFNDTNAAKDALDAVFSAEKLADAERMRTDTGGYAGKFSGISYADAMAPHPELLEELETLHDIDGLLDAAKAAAGRAASATKAAAAKGAKAVTGKAAGGVASAAAGVAERAQRVELGQYSVDQLIGIFDGLALQYKWLKNARVPTAQLLKNAAYFAWATSMRNLIQSTPSRIAANVYDTIDKLREFVDEQEAGEKEVRAVDLPNEFPSLCTNYTTLGRNLYGIYAAYTSSVDKRKTTLAADLKKIKTQLVVKYERHHVVSFIDEFFSELKDIAKNHPPVLVQ